MVYYKKDQYEEFREYLDCYRTTRFHFRLQKKVRAFYLVQPNDFCHLCEAAIDRFQDAILSGYVNTERVSRFREREDLQDKLETVVRIDVRYKDFIEKLAFALRVSQAEVLRMALEWWMEVVLEARNEEVSVPARKKWHHSMSLPHMDTLTFSFWKFGRELYWRYLTLSEDDLPSSW